MASTNALTARYCAAQDWPCETVQSRRGPKRHDLFGIVDSILLRELECVWIQNCSYGTLKAHRRTIDSSPQLGWVDLAAQPLEIWEWRKKKVGRRGLWFLRVQKRANAAWGEVSEWDGPHDLYPRKQSASAAQSISGSAGAKKRRSTAPL